MYEFKADDAYRFAKHLGIRCQVRNGQLHFYKCPYCNGSKSNGNNEVFAIDLKTGMFKCLRASCGVTGNMITLSRDFDFSLGTEADEYYRPRKKYRRLPTPKKPYVPKDPAIRYLESRGISDEVAHKYEITVQSEKENILVFPFYDDRGILQFVKYRKTDFVKDRDKNKEWCEKGCRPVLFGMKQCNDKFDRLIVTEGQMDSLSVASAGLENAVSVPNGALGFTWVPYCFNWVSKFQEIVVFGDFEKGRMTLLEDFQKRFPNRIRHVREQDYQGCNVMLGQDPQKAIDAIAKKMKTSKHNAGRLVMTEEAYFSSAAQKDCFNDLDVEEYEIVATLDSHTSDICQSLDGQVFPMKDFEPGITAPPFHVYCRSTTVPHFDENFGQVGERAARDEEGNTYYVPDNMNHQEWKETFVNGGDKTELQEVKMIMEKPENTGYNVRNEKEFESAANSIRSEITKYTTNAPKWSGKINVNNDLLQKGIIGEKEWTCDISVVNTADDGTVWHEMLHACSASYYTPDIYECHQYIEEASVEFLKQQICREKGIACAPAYENLVPVLQVINNEFHYGSDMKFAKELFSVPLPDRYKWLEDKVVDSLKDADVSFEDFNEVLFFIRKLKGGENG